MTEKGAYPDPERRDRARIERSSGPLKVLFGLLRWIGEHVRGFHAALGLYFVLGLAVLVVAVGAFVGIAEIVGEGETQRMDDAILLWLNSRANPALDAVALEVTALGGVAVVWLVLLLATVFLWETKHRYSAFLLWASYLGASAVNFALKSFFDRPRPQLFEWRTPMAGHSSFPSGHSTTAVAVFATLAYLLLRLEPTRAMRRLTVAVAAIIIVLIGWSRLYLGVHYPSDVVGGFALGLGWATFCAMGLEVLRYFRGRKPSVARDEHDLEKGSARARDTVGPRPTPES